MVSYPTVRMQSRVYRLIEEQSAVLNCLFSESTTHCRRLSCSRPDSPPRYSSLRPLRLYIRKTDLDLRRWKLQRDRLVLRLRNIPIIADAGYGSNQGMNSGYGSGTYGSSLGVYGTSYGGGMYGCSSMSNRGDYGGGLYGSSGVYGGGGMYNISFGGTMGGCGMGTKMGMGMGPYGGQDPNYSFNQPPSPPGFWISFLPVLFDRGGMLYGELARFVLLLLGVRTKPQTMQQPPKGPNGLPSPHQPHGNQNYTEGPKAPAPGGGGGRDNVWSN